MRILSPLVVFAMLLLAAYAPSLPEQPAASASLANADTVWTWPERGKNLRVLPVDTPPERLREVMRGATASLGVSCDHCHVGEEGTDFHKWDFASDEKPTKDIARAMMEMTWQINTQTLPAIDGIEASDDWSVTCWTCHRGSVTPDK